MNTPETRYVAVGEAEVAYQVIGEGSLDLVYHHGLCQLDLQWDVAPEAAFNSRLAAFSRLILFDRRGSGASERAARADFPTWEVWSEDLVAVLDALGPHRAALCNEVVARHPAGLVAGATPNGDHAGPLGRGRRPSDRDGAVRYRHARETHGVHLG